MENWIIIAICFGAVIIFVVFWCAVVLLISRIAWAKLARQFATDEVPSGRRYRFATAFFPPLTSYKNSLTVTLTETGLHIAALPFFRLGHPPVLIPKGCVESCSDYDAFVSSICLFSKTRIQIVAKDSTFSIMLPPDAKDDVDRWLGIASS